MMQQYAMCPLHALLMSALETRASAPLTWKYISLIQFISTQFTQFKKKKIRLLSNDELLSSTDYYNSLSKLVKLSSK